MEAHAVWPIGVNDQKWGNALQVAATPLVVDDEI